MKTRGVSKRGKSGLSAHILAPSYRVLLLLYSVSEINTIGNSGPATLANARICLPLADDEELRILDPEG
jgi:hypothetical protein